MYNQLYNRKEEMSMKSLNMVKTFSTMKIDINTKELMEYFTNTGILVNNLTNVCIY